MPSARQIKQRIKSAKNISKITKAMEMVSASKMRRSLDQAQTSRPYAEALQATLHKISQYTDPSLHPLLQTHPEGKNILIIFSTDRGLCGALNANLFRAAHHWVKEQENVEVIVVGKKAKQFARIAGWQVYAEFSGLPDKVTYADSLPISGLILREFLAGTFKTVHSIHMQSITTLTQKPMLNDLLPITQQELKNEQTSGANEYTFEPEPQEILNWLLPYYIENDIYFSLLEAKASEHSARMLAMKNASDNANEIVSVLNLEYNRSRQANITKELQEITTATLALS